MIRLLFALGLLLPIYGDAQVKDPCASGCVTLTHADAVALARYIRHIENLVDKSCL